MRITHLLVLGLLGAALPVSFASADTDGERTVLAQIIHELQSIEPLIRQAESQANPDSRIHFRYDWLRQDLSEIKGAEGIFFIPSVPFNQLTNHFWWKAMAIIGIF